MDFREEVNLKIDKEFLMILTGGLLGFLTEDEEGLEILVKVGEERIEEFTKILQNIEITHTPEEQKERTVLLFTLMLDKLGISKKQEEGE